MAKTEIKYRGGVKELCQSHGHTNVVHLEPSRPKASFWIITDQLRSDEVTCRRTRSMKMNHLRFFKQMTKESDFHHMS